MPIEKIHDVGWYWYYVTTKALLIFVLSMTPTSSLATADAVPPTRSRADASSSSAIVESYSIVIGLNPALQKRFVLSPSTPSLVSGNVHRASEIQEGIGGKGQDVFTSLSCLCTADHNHSHNNTDTTTATVSAAGPSHDVRLLQFLGSGGAGNRLASLLSRSPLHRSVDDGDDDGVSSLTIRTQSPLRTCTTVVGHDAATELVEPSGAVSQLEVERLRRAVDRYLALVPSTAAAASGGTAVVNSVCVMGSMPPGCPPELYASLYDRIVAHDHSDDNGDDPICLVDSVVGLDHLLEAMAKRRMRTGGQVRDNRNALKINLTELIKLAAAGGSDGRGQGGGGSSTTPSSKIGTVREALQNFYDTYPNARKALGYIAITDGKDPSYLIALGPNGRHTDTLYEMNVPSLLLSEGTTDDGAAVQTTLYPIGAGDTVAAGTLASWQYLLDRRRRQRRMGEDQSSSTEEWEGDGWIDDRVRRALAIRDDQDQDHLNTADYQTTMVVSFAFGLACGSASCLREENSVFGIDEALRLFRGMDRPRRIVVEEEA